MGLPRLYGRVGVQAGEPIGPSGKEDRQSDYPPLREHGVGWTIAYYIFLVLGAVGFSFLLFPLTDSSHALSVVFREQ